MKSDHPYKGTQNSGHASWAAAVVDMVRALSRRKKLNSEKSPEPLRHDRVEAKVKEPGSDSWSPSVHRAFQVLMFARICAAFWSNISDCDETFNYLEPVHYLLNGHGFQTWEYSPSYAIRSYAYLWLCALPLKAFRTLFDGEKILHFLVLRLALAFTSASCDTYFYSAVLSKFGRAVGRLSLLFLALGPGMFVSSTAFLPSSFAMYTTALAAASWYRGGRVFPPVFFTALGSLVGWPFAAALGIPIAYDLVVNKRRWFMFAFCSLLSLIICLVPMVMIDSHYYGKLVVTPLNIIKYNVFSGHGPDLYGVEPWTYYFVNGFLNFNVAFPLAIASLLVLILKALIDKTKKDRSNCLWILGLHIWMLIFFTRPHKEERFLFPVYPLICLSAALCFDTLMKLAIRLVCLFSGSKRDPLPHHRRPLFRLATAGLVLVFVAASLSRILALHRGYHAPIEVYEGLNKAIRGTPWYANHPGRTWNVCVGKEWYRFPSHFFLPDRCHLKFVRSEFRGQLPREFSEGPNATREVPSSMNDLNLEEMDRYVDPSLCDYLVDLDTGSSSEFEPNYSRQDGRWKVVLTRKFLDASRSHRLFRAFYVPFLSEGRVHYADYNVLVPASGGVKNRRN